MFDENRMLLTWSRFHFIPKNNCLVQLWLLLMSPDSFIYMYNYVDMGLRENDTLALMET